MKTEYIYLIYEGNNIFKIGRTSHIKKRLNAYKTHNSQVEGYIAVFEVRNSKIAERYLHNIYDKYKVSSEFFELPIEELVKLESKVIGLKTSYISKQYLDFTNLE